MSLFFRYDRPGRGISKEEAKERNYFKILGRKLSLIIKANLLFFTVNIILILLLIAPVISLLINAANGTADPAISYYARVFSGKQLMSPIPFLILALFSPTFAGLTYLCRNFAKQEHVFLTSDFFEHTKKNWKQSLPAGFILSAVLYVYMTAFFFYWNTDSIVLRAAISLIGILFVYASFYVFPQIVTFDLSIGKILKNAIIFSVANLPYNTLVFVVLTVLHVFLIRSFTFLWIILMIFFLIAFSTYTVNYIVWSTISKHMINESNSEEEASGRKL